MHATEIQWYIVVCYDKLSVQQCLYIYTATELNLKGDFCRNPRNPSRSATEFSTVNGQYLADDISDVIESNIMLQHLNLSNCKLSELRLMKITLSVVKLSI